MREDDDVDLPLRRATKLGRDVRELARPAADDEAMLGAADQALGFLEDARIPLHAEGIRRRGGRVDLPDGLLEGAGRGVEALAKEREDLLRRGGGEALGGPRDGARGADAHQAAKHAVDGRARDRRANADLVARRGALLEERVVRARFVQAEPSATSAATTPPESVSAMGISHDERRLGRFSSSSRERRLGGPAAVGSVSAGSACAGRCAG